MKAGVARQEQYFGTTAQTAAPISRQNVGGADDLKSFIIYQFMIP